MTVLISLLSIAILHSVEARSAAANTGLQVQEFWGLGGCELLKNVDKSVNDSLSACEEAVQEADWDALAAFPTKKVCFSIIYSLKTACSKPHPSPRKAWMADLKPQSSESFCPQLIREAALTSKDDCSTQSQQCKTQVQILRDMAQNNESYCSVCHMNRNLCLYAVFALRAANDDPEKNFVQAPVTMGLAKSPDSDSMSNDASDGSVNVKGGEAENPFSKEANQSSKVQPVANSQLNSEDMNLSATHPSTVNSIKNDQKSVVHSTTKVVKAEEGGKKSMNIQNRPEIVEDTEDVGLDTDGIKEGVDNFESDLLEEGNDDAPSLTDDQVSPSEKHSSGNQFLVDKLSKTGIDEQPNYLFSYFLLLSIVAIAAYLVLHNKQKILALILEGRRSRSTKGRRGRSSSAQYRKLDNNLEEAMGTGSKGSDRHVIY